MRKEIIEFILILLLIIVSGGVIAYACDVWQWYQEDEGYYEQIY